MRSLIHLTVFLGISFSSFAQSPKTDLLILGSDHLGQIYNSNNTNTDVLTPKRQKEIQDVAARMYTYRPDMVMVEVLPERQHEIDSLYSLYLQNKLLLEQLPDGRSEVYQLAFRIGKQMKLNRIHCVNAPGGTSQAILSNGEHIELYQKEQQELRALVGQKYAALQNGSLSFPDFYQFLNQPETYKKVYHLRYITPARVTNGTFKNPDAMVDTVFINPRYIGAELTSIFKNRDLKIYANIVAAKNAGQSQKALLIIGVAHIGSLKNILRDDDEFNLIEANQYLRK